MSALFSLLFLVSAIAFIVFWWKKRSARKAAGDNYETDLNYQEVSKKKHIIGIVCIASLVLSVALAPSAEERAANLETQKIQAEKEATEKAEKEAKDKADKEQKDIQRVANLSGEEKVIFDNKFQEYLNSMSEADARSKALADVDSAMAEKREIALREQKAAEESKRKQDAMQAEMTTGWNTATTDADSDATNFLKAANLLKDYYTNIRNADAIRADAETVMQKPWEYYGKVVSVYGRVYDVEHLPPGHNIPKFFNKDCAHAMMATDNGVYLTLYIVGDVERLHEDAYMSVKGLIYGHVGLQNTTFGGHSKGLGFIGFVE